MERMQNDLPGAITASDYLDQAQTCHKRLDGAEYLSYTYAVRNLSAPYHHRPINYTPELFLS